MTFTSRLTLSASAGIAAWILFSNHWAALLTALATLVWRPAVTTTKVLFVLDTDTGEMKAQAQDAAAERYLRDK